GAARAFGRPRPGDRARRGPCHPGRARVRAARSGGRPMTLLIGLVSATPAPAPVPGANIFTSPFLLSLLVWLPVIVAAAIAVMPNPRGRYDTLMKQIAFFTILGLTF